jgi:hypothetical protein
LQDDADLVLEDLKALFDERDAALDFVETGLFWCHG